MDKQSEELIYAVMKKIQRLMDYLVKAKEAKRASRHFVQDRITMFKDPNKQMDILTENIALLKKTLEKIEQLHGNLNLVTKNRQEKEHSTAIRLPTSAL